jgi:MscS family membrane protein
MNRFLEQVFLDNTVADWLWTIGIILAVIIVNKILSRYLAKLACRLINRKWKIFDEYKFVDLILHPLSTFLIVTISIITLYRLRFPAALNITIYKYELQAIFLSIGTIIQLGALTWLVLRFIDFISTLLERRADLTPSQADNQLILFFRDFLKVVIGIIGLMMILHFAFSFNISNLVTGLSIVGAAIALSLRESLENLVASFIIFFDKPFTTGDLVKVQNVTGNVEKIGLRSTRLRTGDKSYVTVPNKQMVDSILDNISKRSQIRGELILYIALQTPPGKIEELITVIKNYLSKIEQVHTYNVLFTDIRVQAFIVQVEFFTPPIDGGLFNSIRQQLNLFILQKMESLEIRMAAEGKDFAIVP